MLKQEKVEQNTQNFYPLCSFCNQEIKNVNAYIVPLNKGIAHPSALGKRIECIITSCPYCRKVLVSYDIHLLFFDVVKSNYLLVILFNNLL